MLADMLWVVRRLRSPCHSKNRFVSALLLVTVGVTFVTMKMGIPAVMPDYEGSQRALWLKHDKPLSDLMITDVEVPAPTSHHSEQAMLVIDGSSPELGPFLSPFVIPAEEDFSKATYFAKKPVGQVDFKNISIWDPTTTDLKTFAFVDFSKCEYNKCHLTSNHSDADAVLFLVDRLNKMNKLPDFTRKQTQYWIFRSMEPPSRFSYFIYLNKTGFKELFNWTMTYRMDSDIPTPYGRLIDTYVTKFKDYDNIFSNKTRSVAIFTSYCEIRSKTLDFVRKLSNKIDVDIFGPCGTKQCTALGPIDWDRIKHKKLDGKDCFPMLTNVYRFYLTFETSICRDYVTEIFFQAYQSLDVVPVVRGGADYRQYFPAGTFIDAADFPNPEALADFLIDVGSDKVKYTQYLHKKHSYIGVPDFPEWQCKLCHRLHTDNSTRTYADIYHWWTGIPCRDPGSDLLTVQL